MVTKARKRERRAQRNAAAARRVADKRTAQAESPKSPVTTELLTRPEDFACDARMIEQATEDEWPVERSVKEIIVQRMLGIVQKTVVMVPCGDGVAPSEAVADKNSIAAGALIEKFVSSNRKAKSKPGGSGPQTTVNVGVQIDANRIDERRRQTLAVIERVRAGRGSVIARRESD